MNYTLINYPKIPIPLPPEEKQKEKPKKYYLGVWPQEAGKRQDILIAAWYDIKKDNDRWPLSQAARDTYNTQKKKQYKIHHYLKKNNWLIEKSMKR